uniref:plant UBX domain-containing protein 1-like n=1 Tax=Erigeron canadensis TaxID=72917 RepID=UPI001CB8DFFA|nr:plant UBX domain-containing protein 1-like [Erigeron canadensis]
MDSQSAKEKLEAAKEHYGREIRVFETTSSSSSSSTETTTKQDPTNTDELPDEFYEFTAEDYYRMLSTKKEDNVMKTRKIREAEQAARRSRITKAVIRVRFPDNHTLEATFHPSETMQSLADLLKKVVAQPDIPFYIYTTPPKKQIKDMSQDLYSAGFAPGAIVYFSYNESKGDVEIAASGSFLKEDVMSLKGLELVAEQEKAEVSQATTTEPVAAAAQQPVQPRKATTDKKMVKPKWLKM